MVTQRRNYFETSRSENLKSERRVGYESGSFRNLSTTCRQILLQLMRQFDKRIQTNEISGF